jgi:restriction system protein
MEAVAAVIFAFIYLFVRPNAAKKKEVTEDSTSSTTVIREDNKKPYNQKETALAEKEYVNTMLQAREKQIKSLRASMDKKTRDLGQQHIQALNRKRKQLVLFDDYGHPMTAAYIKEVKYFISNVVLESFTKEERDLWVAHEDKYTKDCIELLDSVVKDYAMANQHEALQYSDALTDREFEIFCADVMEAQGWKVQLGKGKRDQGIDVLCKKAGKTVCIQCKKFSQPVGNSAVQEAYAGKGFSGADIAAVVSNAAYTPSARQLASTNGVLLLHYDDLRDLDSLTGIATSIS